MESAKEFATKIYMDVCERVEKDGFIAKGFIETYTEEIAARDAQRRKEAADRIIYFLKQTAEWHDLEKMPITADNFRKVADFLESNRAAIENPSGKE